MKFATITSGFLLSAIAFSLFATPLQGAHASSHGGNKDQKEIVNDLGINSGGNDDFNLPNVEADDNAVQNVLQTIFIAAGAVSVIFVAVGGLRYVISDGNEQRIKQAKETILYAIVGLIVSISAYGIVGFFISSLL